MACSYPISFFFSCVLTKYIDYSFYMLYFSYFICNLICNFLCVLFVSSGGYGFFVLYFTSIFLLLLALHGNYEAVMILYKQRRKMRKIKYNTWLYSSPTIFPYIFPLFHPFLLLFISKLFYIFSLVPILLALFMPFPPAFLFVAYFVYNFSHVLFTYLLYIHCYLQLFYVLYLHLPY